MLRRKAKQLPTQLSSPDKKTVKAPVNDAVKQEDVFVEHERPPINRSDKRREFLTKKQLQRAERKEALETATEAIADIVDRSADEYLKLYEEGEKLEAAVLGAEDDVLEQLKMDQDSDDEDKKQVSI